MKKAESEGADEMRPEYKRSDFGALVRGKYATRLAASSNVVMLEPEVARAFPNSQAVNEALLSLIRVAKAAARPPSRSGQRSAKGHSASAR